MKARRKPARSVSPSRKSRTSRRASTSLSKRKTTLAISPTKPPRPTVSEVIESVLIQGDLTPLTPAQRLEYYNAVCKSLGLNPLTRPFDYIAFKATENSPAKLVLYARKDCTEQLRKIHGIAITACTNKIESEMFVVSVEVRDKHGRTDSGMGVVEISGLRGKALANAMMKAETKAKRRATLSMAGLGFLDESEIDGLDSYGTLTPGGRIMTPQISEHEKHYLEREAEGLEKLTPAQREVVVEKMKSANSPMGAASEHATVPSSTPVRERGQAVRLGAPDDVVGQSAQPTVLWTYHKESDTYEIEGPKELLSAHKQEVFGKLWNGTVQKLVATPLQFEDMKHELDIRKISYKRKE
jgi:hypothetical protein